MRLEAQGEGRGERDSVHGVTHLEKNAGDGQVAGFAASFSLPLAPRFLFP